MLTKKPQKNPKKYFCKNCVFYSNNKKDFNRHLQTKKHNANNANKKTPFLCECGKEYKQRSSLSRHKKLCSYIIECDYGLDSEEETNNVIVDKDSKTIEKMFLHVVEKNQELQELMCLQNDKIIEMANQPKTIVNNSFNLSNFLNIQCKDAMNLSEFLENIQITFDDLKYLSNHGFVESFKETFVKQLVNMEETLRPIHCTDQKRKSVIVKENDVWKKDNNYEVLHKAIDTVNKKQFQAFSKHNKERDPSYMDSDANQITNSHMIMNMCSYNISNKDRIHRNILKDIVHNSKIIKKNNE